MSPEVNVATFESKVGIELIATEELVTGLCFFKTVQVPGALGVHASEVGTTDTEGTVTFPFGGENGARQ